MSNETELESLQQQLRSAAGDLVSFRMKEYAEQHKVPLDVALDKVLAADPQLKRQYALGTA